MGETVLKQLTNETNRMLDQVIRDLRRLPYDAEIEYLESTGTQYIDTGIVPTNQTGFYVSVFTAPTGTLNNRLIGCYDGTTRFLFACSPKSSNNTFFGWNEALGPYGNLVNVAVTASLNFLNDRKAVLNGETKSSELGTLGALTSTIFLFGHNSNGSAFTSQLFSGRVYTAKISEGSNLIRDFIPVRLGTTGYLYDKVSGQLFGNSGTGEFVLGPDKKTTRDYIQDGLVAMWDGIENTREREHDPNATSWVNLIDGASALDYSWALTENATWEYNALKANGSGIAATSPLVYFTQTSSPTVPAQCFLEIVASGVGSTSVGGCVWINANSSDFNAGLIVRNNAYYYGFAKSCVNIQRTTCFSMSSNPKTYLSALTRYFNGTAFTGTNMTATFSSTIQGSSIGAFPDGTNPRACSIHSIRIYNRVLSAEEVAANFAIDKARFKIS